MCPTFFSELQSGLSLIYRIITKFDEQESDQKRCLRSHWATVGSVKPSLRPYILAIIFAALWILVLMWLCTMICHYNLFDKLRDSIHQFSIKTYNCQYPYGYRYSRLQVSLVCHGVLYRHYLYSRSLPQQKQNRSWIEEFGQIMALCTVVISAWRLVWYTTGKCYTTTLVVHHQ